MKAFPSFAEYFEALWDRPPHPWQSRLAAQVEATGWPSGLALPTGTGKTACLDIAVHVLAKQAATPGLARSAPVRIVLAVNRRVVVDGAFSRAQRIGRRLQDALGQPADALHPVAKALWTLAGAEDEAPPLQAFPLRGGSYRDNAWARSPLQPMLISTTLDQLGSRLLFRGYGVSDSARPLHAALLANDTLLLLDEAHTALPFRQTLEAIQLLRRTSTEGLGLPFAVTQLTATPVDPAPDTFTLGPEDLDPQRSPDLVKRLSAAKPTTLVEIKGAKGGKRHDKLATAVTEHALAHLKNGHARILVVVNRVATADAAAAALRKALAKHAAPAASVALLTGRMRPLDREEALAELRAYGIETGAHAPAGRTLILVATQCVEVGADFDFDALVSELAPLDALRQRFGRLNRAGRPGPAPATLLAPEESLQPARPDPVYGECLPKVWAWLNRIKDGLDFGVESLRPHLPSGADLTECLAPAEQSPILLPSHLDLLCQTFPRPQVEPDPTCYIHGMEKRIASVSVVFRDPADLIFPPSGDSSVDEATQTKLRAAPPFAGEAAEIPLYQARKWLGGESTDDSSDAFAGEVAELPPKAVGQRLGVLPLRWSEDEATPVHGPASVRPGDFLILPAGEVRPGLLTLPGPHAPDQYEDSFAKVRDRLALRITPARWKDVQTIAERNGYTPRQPVLIEAGEEGAQASSIDLAALHAELPRLLPRLAGQNAGAAWARAVDLQARLAKEGETTPSGWRVIRYGADGALLTHPDRLGLSPWPLEPDAAGRQGDDPGLWNGLVEHQQAVADRVTQFVRALPLASRPGMESLLALAARTHDLGKADPRFQARLHGLPHYRCRNRPLLAKSQQQNSRPPTGEEGRLPDGFRHELLSALILQYSGHLRAHPEHDLLLHLVASHHGRCRPFAPPVPDPEPETFAVEVEGARVAFPGDPLPLAHVRDGVADRFWRLTRRFGWWGLAYLELVLRLADQSVSAQRKGRTP